MAAETVRRFGIEPRVALLSTLQLWFLTARRRAIRQALELVRDRAPDLMIDGEIQAMQRWWKRSATTVCRTALWKGSANILVMPNMEAAAFSYNLLRISSSEGVTVGPVLMGVAKPSSRVNADCIGASYRQHGGAAAQRKPNRSGFF
ncbi:phosphate acyltransferase [Escherichia coli]